MNTNIEARNVKLITLTVIIVMSSSLFLWAKTDEVVPYPKGYLKWTHIKKETMQSQNAERKGKTTIYHIYANEKAVEGYRTRKFADGSMIVSVFYDTKETDGKLEETTRLAVAVMAKDSKRFASTGGWGFEQFKGDSEIERMLNAEGVAGCYGCHSKQKEQDLVYSTFSR